MFKGKTFDDMDLNELNENEDLVDDEDDRVFEEYRFVLGISQDYIVYICINTS